MWTNRPWFSHPRGIKNVKVSQNEFDYNKIHLRLYVSAVNDPRPTKGRRGPHSTDFVYIFVEEGQGPSSTPTTPGFG